MFFPLHYGTRKLKSLPKDQQKQSTKNILKNYKTPNIFFCESQNPKIGSSKSYQSSNIPNLLNQCTPTYFSCCQTTCNFWQQIVSFKFSFSEFWPNSIWERLMQGRVGKRQFARYGYLEKHNFYFERLQWRICTKNLHCFCFLKPFIWNVPKVFMAFAQKKILLTNKRCSCMTYQVQGSTWLKTFNVYKSRVQWYRD